MYKLFPFILTATLLVGCSTLFSQKTIEVTNENYQILCKPLILKPYQKLRVTLPSSKISGYKWQLKNNGSPILLLKKSKTQKDETPENRLHRQETIWEFIAQQTGKTTLSFIYQLDWDNNIEDAQKIQCEIDARND